MADNQRLGSVDFWRGAILVVIMIDHIPGNLLETATPRNFGFSDSAEAFVFLSGLSVGLAYYRQVLRSDLLGVARRCAARAFRIYGIHLALTACAVLVFAVAYDVSMIPGLADGDGRSFIFHHPQRGLLGVLLLSQQLGYFNILPLYVVLMLWSPFVLALAKVHPALAVALSLVIYAAARLTGLALPNWPEPGTWFFNPFAWQLVFTIGIVAGIVWRERPPRYSSTLFAAAATGVAGAALIVTSAGGLLPGLHERVFEHLDLLKQNLGLARVVHFLLVVYLIVQVPALSRLADTAPGRELQRLGRHSLLVFALGSLFTAFGQAILRLADANFSGGVPTAGLLYTMFGVAGLFLFARYLEWSRQSLARRRVAVARSSRDTRLGSAHASLPLRQLPAKPG